MTLEEYRYFLGMGKKQKLNNMGLQRKIRLPDTQFLQNEYLRAVFFSIDPYSSFYALFVANLVSHNSFFLYRPKTQNAHSGRNVMPRCLSEGVDIFLKSAAAVSLFNRKFTPGDATSRRDVPFAVGVRGVYGNPTLRAMHPIHKCVAKGAPHLLAVLRNEPRYS